MDTTLRDIIDIARDELREQCKDSPDFDPTDEAIHEIANGAVPVYISDLMEMAVNDIDLAMATPELGPAFDGTPTPVNIIAANVYEAVTAALYVEWETIKDEREE
ncbi:hypothetical protein LCGC14_2257610, partial [marine sediment metagenome]